MFSVVGLVGSANFSELISCLDYYVEIMHTATGCNYHLRPNWMINQQVPDTLNVTVKFSELNFELELKGHVISWCNNDALLETSLTYRHSNIWPMRTKGNRTCPKLWPSSLCPVAY